MRLPVLTERRRGTKFLEQPVDRILNPPESTGMGFWSLNPYVGCEFGCAYCFARFAHRYVVERARDAGFVAPDEFADLRGPHGWEAFERRIFVKRRDDVLAALERDLRRVRRRNADGRQSIAIGTATDPYQPAERTFGVTRAALERLRRERGFRIGIITKSPLVARDVELLSALGRRHCLRVHISLMSMEADVIRAFEPRSPLPHARLRALRTLVEGGVDAGLIVAPVLPGVTDSAEALRALLRAARQVGARFAHPSVLRLYPAVRGPFLPALAVRFPGLRQRYERAYGRATAAPAAYRRALSIRFNAIAASIGVPVDVFEGGTPPPGPAQMGLFDGVPAVTAGHGSTSRGSGRAAGRWVSSDRGRSAPARLDPGSRHA